MHGPGRSPEKLAQPELMEVGGTLGGLDPKRPGEQLGWQATASSGPGLGSIVGEQPRRDHARHRGQGHPDITIVPLTAPQTQWELGNRAQAEQPDVPSGRVGGRLGVTWAPPLYRERQRKETSLRSHRRVDSG